MSDPIAVTTAEAPGPPAGGRRRAQRTDRPRSLAGDAWRNLRSRKIFWVAAALAAVILLMAL